MENRKGIVFPLSSAQSGIWMAYALSSNPENYNVGEYLEINGTLDINILEKAVRNVIKNDAAMQLFFYDTDEGMRQSIAALDDWLLPILDYSRESNPLESAKAYMYSNIKKMRDIFKPPLFDYAIIKLADDRHILYQSIHHIALDGLSCAIIVQKTAQMYNLLISDGALDVPPADDHQNIRSLIDADIAYRSSPRFLRDKQFWCDRFSDLPEALTLASKSARESAIIHYHIDLPSHLDALIKTLPKQLKCTQPQLLITLTTIYLYRMTGQKDAVIGLPVTARADAQLRKITGMMSNILPMRLSLSPTDLLDDVLQLVGREVRGVLRHQQYRYEDILHDLNLLSVNQSLIKTSINIESFDQNIEFQGAKVRARNLTNGPVNDLNIFFFNYGNNLEIELAFDANSELYNEQQLAAHAQRMFKFFEDVLNAPHFPIGLHPLLSNAEKNTLLLGNRATDFPIPALSLAEMFERQAVLTADAIAISDNADKLTYSELNARANNLAQRLVSSGVVAGDCVGILMDRSINLIVAMLAILKAGGCYLPLRITDPLERQRIMLNDSKVRLLLVDAAITASELPQVKCHIAIDSATLSLETSENLAVKRYPDDLAYVMYTSGSTGQPKGIAVTQENVIALANDRRWKTGDHKRVLMHSPHAFDASTYEIWAPLLLGSEIIVAPRGELDINDLAKTIQQRQVTALWLTAGLFRLIAEEQPECLTEVNCLIAGGDVLPKSAIQAVINHCPNITIVNGYGPTETTTFATNYEMRMPLSLGHSVPIGTPMDNTQVYVLDIALQQVPIGIAGELYIAGNGLARGYLNQPGQSAERFVANPYGKPGERMYRSGDMVRWREEGVLEFVGRADQLVKIRGFRIEPGEIEAKLQSHPLVAQAIVIAREDKRSNKQLVAYIVAVNGSNIDGADIREWVMQQLPDFMVPALVIVLATLPLTANGKVDMRALPEPEFVLTKGREPRTQQEEILCGLFAEILCLDNIGIDDNFFDLGGHSLLATRLIGNIRKTLSIELTIRDLFNAPTVALLTQCLAEKRSLRLALKTYPRPEHPPLSFAQKRLWLVDQIDENGATYNIPLALKFSGEVHVEALQKSINDLIYRHESLRTLFKLGIDAEPYQHIVDSVQCPLERVKVSESSLADALLKSAGFIFNLAESLPIRATLFEIDQRQSVLLLLIHHIASDGGSVTPLLRDLSVSYNAYLNDDAPQLPPLPVHYVDYSLWQRELLGDETCEGTLLAQQSIYWQQRLAGLPEEISLPLDRPRPQIASYKGAYVDFCIEADLLAQLKRLSRSEGVTLFMILQASLSVLLHKMGAGDDIPLGTPIAGRTDESLNDLIGYFANTLVLRNDLSANPNFRQLLKQVREHTLDAYANQDIPFERLVEILNPSRSLSRHPLFQVMLVLQNHGYRQTTFNGLESTPEPVLLPIAKFDLTFTFEEPIGLADDELPSLKGAIEYATDLFDGETVTAMAKRFVQLLTAVAQGPDQTISRIDLLPEEERQRVIHDWNSTTTPLLPLSLAQLFEQQVRLTPHHIALSSQGDKLSYEALNMAANRLARHLLKWGLKPEDSVALLMDRSIDLVIAILAVVKAGGCYLPLRISDPIERQQIMVNDSRCKIVVTDSLLASGPLPKAESVIVFDRNQFADQESTDLHLDIHPHSLAYIMYTSGSTGVPKGIAITHDNVAGLARDRRWLNFNHSRVLFHSPHAFDASTYELWAPLLQGAEVVVAAKGELDIAQLAQIIVSQSITSLWLTAGLFRLVAEEQPQCLSSVSCLIAGGDVLPTSAIQAIIKHCPNITVVNGYGPTETTTFATNHPMKAPLSLSHSVPIGSPLDNTQVYVLDDLLRPAPIGVAGELYIAGNGLARGYVNQSAQTAERFVANPFGKSGERMYRSGDMVRWRRDGILEFVGRADQLVKIRGFRIELAEIETVLDAYPGVSQTVTIARADINQRKQLVTYIVPAESETIEPKQVRQWASQRLPDFMVPAAVVILTKLPLTANGKVDIRALPEPEFNASQSRLPLNGKEQLLCDLFANVLNLQKVGVDDSFFDLGGDSITAIQLVSRARQAGWVLTPKDVFQHKRVSELALIIHEAADLNSLSTVNATGELPATPIIHWLMEHTGPIDAFNQAMILNVPAQMTEGDLNESLRALLRHHDILRMVMLRDECGGWKLSIPSEEAVNPLKLLSVVDTSCLNSEELIECIKDQAKRAKGRLSPQSGVMVQAVWLRHSDNRPGRLLLVIHHLVVDGVSWRILVPDLESAWLRIQDGQDANLMAINTTFKTWAERLNAEAVNFRNEKRHWCHTLNGIDKPLAARRLDPTIDVSGNSGHYTIELASQATLPLLGKVPSLFHGTINDVLLTAFALAVSDWRRQRGNGHQTDVLLDLEGHGREEFADTDLSRTVGWFTSMYPVRLNAGIAGFDDKKALSQAVTKVKDQLRQIPGKGLGYGLLRYLDKATSAELAQYPTPEISFNYLGRFSAGDDSDWRIAKESAVLDSDGDAELSLSHVLSLNAVVEDRPMGSVLVANWSWAGALLDEQSVTPLAQSWFQILTTLSELTEVSDVSETMQSNTSMVSLNQGALDKLQAKWKAKK